MYFNRNTLKHISKSSYIYREKRANMTKIAVIGPGAVGASLTFALSHTFDVTLIGRKNQTIHFQESNAQVQKELTVRAIEAVQEPFDVIFIAVKTHQLAAVIPELGHLTHANTLVILAQNGYGQLKQLADYHAYQAVVYISGKKQEQHVTHFRDYKLHIQADAHTKQLARQLKDAPLELVLEDHIENAIWYKLIVNLGINTITALGRDTARVLHDDAMVQLCRHLLEEGTAVAQAEGIQLEDNIVDAIMKIYAGYPDEMGTSMYYDIMQGQPLEVDAIQGYIYQRAQAYQIAVPHLETVYTLLAYQNAK